MAYDGGYSIDPVNNLDLTSFGSVLPPIDYTMPDLGGYAPDLTSYLPDLSGGDTSSWDKILSTLGGTGGLGAAGIGALLGSMDGSKQTGTQTVTSAPWSGQQPYLLDLFQRAQTQSQQPGNSPEMNSIFGKMMGNAGIGASGQSGPLGMNFNQNGVLVGPLEMQRISEAAQSYNQATGQNLTPQQYDAQINPTTYMDRWGGNSQPQDLSGASQSVIQNNLNSDPTKAFGIGRTNPYMGQNTTVGTNPYAGVDNPYLNASINNASQDAMRNLNPAFIQSQIGSGSFGNSGLGETFARSAASTLGNIATNARMQDYTQQQGLAENALNRNLQNDQYNKSLNSGLAQQSIQNDLSQYNTANSNQLNSAFNVPSYQGVNQNNLTNLYGVANTQNQNQWKPLQNYGSLVTGNYGSTNSSPIYSNPTASALGGGLLGSQIYSNIFGGK